MEPSIQYLPEKSFFGRSRITFLIILVGLLILGVALQSLISAGNAVDLLVPLPFVFASITGIFLVDKEKRIVLLGMW